MRWDGQNRPQRDIQAVGEELAISSKRPRRISGPAKWTPSTSSQPLKYQLFGVALSDRGPPLNSYIAYGDWTIPRGSLDSAL